MRFVILVLVPLVAHAQQPSVCTGGQLTGVVSLADADTTTIQAASVPFIFGAAECQCDSNDLLMDIQLTSAFPAGTVGTVELWAGNGCDVNSTARTAVGTTICEKLPTSLTFSKFVTGGTSQHIYVPISALPLFSPVLHQCPAVAASNSLYLLFFSGANSNTAGPPLAACTLPLIENPEGPAAPTALTATAGDSAVTLTWSPPDPALAQPIYYQVLCADASDAPLPSPASPAYSTCQDGTLERRPISSASLPSGGLQTLDHAFVCADAITSSSQRISGLHAGSKYQFLVVAIDSYGNATPSQVVEATPLGAPASGGCDTSSGSTATGGALLLILALALSLRAWRRA